MKDSQCVAFLQWALPRLHMRWAGFRKVRRQVCKRVDRRLSELGLPDVMSFQAYLRSHPEEWSVLDSCCRISISRFYRDRAVFDHLRERVLPDLASNALRCGDRQLRSWSAGCASGEEAYTLQIIWRLSVAAGFPALTLQVVATDADEQLLGRAAAGCYPTSSLKDLPGPWLQPSFRRVVGLYRVADEMRQGIDFLRQDIRHETPPGPFHLVLCRNLAFTYYDQHHQERIVRAIVRRLAPGGVLLVGKHEQLPAAAAEEGLEARPAELGFYRKRV